MRRRPMSRPSLAALLIAPIGACIGVSLACIVSVVSHLLEGTGAVSFRTCMLAGAAGFLIGAISVASPIVTVQRRRFRISQAQCPGCGYDIRSIPSEVCPECGEVR